MAAILHGFELWSNQIPLFTKYPVVLIVLGALTLGLTGTLYKAMKKVD